MSSTAEPQPWEAILIATMAGGATVIGGLSLFVVKRFKPVPFSIALGLAGGVMTYVTMVEMIPETIHGCSLGLIEIENWKLNPRSETIMNAFGWLLGTCCVFLGWFLGWVISTLLDMCLVHCDLIGELHFDIDGNLKKEDMILTSSSSSISASEEQSEDENLALCASNSLDFVSQADLSRFFDSNGNWNGRAAMDHLIEQEHGSKFTRFLYRRKRSVDQAEYAMIRMANSAFRHDQKKFLRIGIFTAVALGIHNLPEGMATYTSYMEDKSFGYGMAFAIAIHNIPEGIAVAIPVYFGTGSWVKALALCFISAIAEPIGACVAMGIKSVNQSPLTDGIMFGFISGFMLRVALSELFFTAFKYDPTNIVAVKSVCLGMAIMAFSLVLFQFTA